MPRDFSFTYYDGSKDTGTIADIMARMGDIRARGAIASGQSKAQVGQTIAGSVGDILQERRDAPVRAWQLRDLQARVQATEGQVSAAQRATQGRDVLAHAVQRFGGDHQKVYGALVQAGFPDVADGYVETTAKADGAWRALRQGAMSDQATATAFEADQLQRILRLPQAQRQGAWTSVQGSLQAHGADVSGLAPEWNDADASRQLALIGPPPKLKAFSAGDVVLDENNPTAQPVFTVPAKAPNSQETDFQLDGKGPTVKGSYVPGVEGQGGRYLYRGEDVTARVTKEPSAAMLHLQMGGGTVLDAPDLDASRPDPRTANKIDARTGFTPNAVYQNALRYALVGTLPAMGNGSAPQVRAARSVIQNKAAAIAAAAGIDLPTLQAEYRANATTLNRLLPQYTATTTASNTAKDNLSLALEQSEQVPRTGSPLANRYLQWVNGHTLTGNPSLTKFETYIYTAAREYAKVTSGGAASAQGLTDSAAKEAEKLLNAAQTSDAFAAATEAMQADMGNVVTNQTKTIAGVSSAIANFLSATNGEAPVTAETPARPAASGAGVSVTSPSGKTYTFPSQAAADQAVTAAKAQGLWK